MAPDKHKSKQKSKSWRLRLITKSDSHQDTRDKTGASKTWSEKVASQVMCQPCPRSQLLAVYYEEQQQSRENVPRVCPRKNFHIFLGNTSLNMCAMFLHAVFFCKSQNFRLGSGHSAEKIRTQRIFCCLSFGLLERRHLLLRHIWQFSKNSYMLLISWYWYLSSRDIVLSIADKEWDFVLWSRRLSQTKDLWLLTALLSESSRDAQMEEQDKRQEKSSTRHAPSYSAARGERRTKNL